LEYSWQLFQWNDEWIRKDFAMMTKGRSSQKISSTNFIQSPENIFIEESASVEYAFINANDGPVYIGKNAVVSEGAMIRGSFVLSDNALVKMGAKIVGATTIGPYCTVSGEIKNSILFGYSNKGHDGYLGDSVIGEWCNLGAGTSNSNVKNSAGDVKVWNAFDEQYHVVGQKCGALIGDYSRFSINSSINTGSYVGVACSIFGNGLLPKVIKDFSFGVDGKYYFDKALRDINNWKKMKKQSLTKEQVDVLKYIFANLK
jgi:UDP-N-acetylglucosamine diphosphorylase/glucosamine-1-phosphate N-acetyltransferase